MCLLLAIHLRDSLSDIINLTMSSFKTVIKLIRRLNNTTSLVYMYFVFVKKPELYEWRYTLQKKYKRYKLQDTKYKRYKKSKAILAELVYIHTNKDNCSYEHIFSIL